MLPSSGYKNKMEAKGSSVTVAVSMLIYANEN